MIEKINSHNKTKIKKFSLGKSLEIIDKYVIFSTTDKRGIITSVSDAFCKISQYSREELLGKPHSFVRHPDMQGKVFEDMWKTIKSGKNWQGIVKNLAKDGTCYWVEAYMEPQFKNDKIVAYSSIRNDITDKILLKKLNKSLNKKIKKEVKKNTQQLTMIQKEQLKSMKLSSIGALAAGITHEINTPLTYIKGNFELMKYDIDELPGSDIKNRMIHDLEIITEGIKRISNIVEAMREVSQASSEIKEKVNLYHTLRTALIISNNNANQITKIYLNNKQYGVDFEKNEFSYISEIQKQRIEQVWIIIINNALDALMTKDQYDYRRLDIFIFEENGKNVIEFKDNAGGIPEEIKDNIFEPFVSGKTSGGIGIGLNVAKKIIQENKGTIIAKNNNYGAVFRIELPKEDKNNDK